MVEKAYLQFPLCCLSFGQDVRARLNGILAYSVIVAGWQLFQKLSSVRQQEFLAGERKAKCIPNDFDVYNWRHKALLYGGQMIGVNFTSCVASDERHAAVYHHISEFVTRHGGDAFVRLKKGWLFDTRDGHGIDYREFSVLCAIYSAIGNKELAIVTRDRIRRCALGYRTAAIMQAELSKRTDGALPLTERQLRDTIERLHRNKFFARCTVARRITYYSIRLDNEAMRKKVLERRTYANFFRTSQAAQDQVLTNAIKQKRSESFKSEAKAPTTPPMTKFPGASRFPTSN